MKILDKKLESMLLHTSAIELQFYHGTKVAMIIMELLKNPEAVYIYIICIASA